MKNKSLYYILFILMLLNCFVTFAKDDLITLDDYYKDKIDIINKSEYDLLKSDVILTKNFVKSNDDININSELINYWNKDKYIYFEIMVNDTYDVNLNGIKPLKYNKKDNVIIIVFDYVKYWELHVGATSDIWVNNFPQEANAEIYYHPNVTGTVVIDESLNTTQINATLNGATYSSVGNHYIICDGVNDFIDMTYNPYTDFNNEFSFFIWLQTTDTTVYSTLYGQYTAGGDYWQFNTNWGVANRVGLYAEGTGGVDLAYFDNASFTNGSWHSFAFTKTNDYDANNWAFYLDGDLQSKTVSTNSATNDYKITITPDFCRQTRTGSGSVNYLDVNVSNILIYSAQLTSQEIENLHNLTRSYYLTVPSDNVAPIVTNLNPVQNTSFVNNSYVNIYANATDTYGINVSLINVTFPNGTTENYTLIKESKDIYNYTLHVLNNGTYNISFVFSDNNSNVNDTEKTFFIVYNTLPSNATSTELVYDSLDSLDSILFIGIFLILFIICTVIYVLSQEQFIGVLAGLLCFISGVMIFKLLPNISIKNFLGVFFLLLGVGIMLMVGFAKN